MVFSIIGDSGSGSDGDKVEIPSDYYGGFLGIQKHDSNGSC